MKVTVDRDGERLLTAAFDRSPITFGAQPHNDVVLNDSFVSGEHAVVMVSRGELIFRDRSTNGSFFENQRITEKELGDGGRISIPPFEIGLSFEVDEQAWKTAYRTDVASQALPTRQLPQPPEAVKPRLGPAPGEKDPDGPAVARTVVLPTATTARDRFHLRVVQGPEEIRGQIFALPGQPARLGRSESADVHLPTETISRSHALLQPLAEGGYLLADLKSSNGCFVDGRRVEEARLADGDEFRLGDVVLQLRRGEPALAEGQGDPARGVPGPRETTPVRPRQTVAELRLHTEAVPGRPGIQLIEVHGRVDSYNYTQLADTVDGVIESGGRYLLIDLSAVDFMSHTGLGVFVKALARLQPLRGDLCLVGLSQRLLDAVSLSHLDSLFHNRLAASREQALAAWRPR